MLTAFNNTVFSPLAESQTSDLRLNSVAFTNVSFANDVTATFLRMSASNIVFSDVILNIDYPNAIDISQADELSFIGCRLGLYQVRCRQ